METNHRRYARIMRWLATAGSAGVGLLVLSSAVHAQGGGSCTPGWSEEFASCVMGVPLALRVVETSTGSVPILGTHLGGFYQTQRRQQVCRRDSVRWRSIGDPLPFGTMPIADVTVFTPAGGSPLVVAITPDPDTTGNPRGQVLAWDGVSWEVLAQTPSGHRFAETAVFSDDLGPALYVGGTFCDIDGQSICRLARWRGPGSDWEQVADIASAVGNAAVHAISVLDDGSGPALYIGGTFDSVDNVPTTNIARWDGSSVGGWSAPGGGAPPDFAVHALAMHQEGGHALLHAGGLTAGGDGVVYRLSAGQWSRLGQSLGARPVRTLAAGFIDGMPRLFAAATRGDIHRWNGSEWHVIGEGRYVAATVYENGPGVLLASADPSTLDSPTLTSWTNTTGWTAEPTGFRHIHSVYTLQGLETDGVHNLFLGGHFLGYNHIASRHGLRWDGSEWHAFGAGRGVVGLAVFDDGSGPALYGGTRLCLLSGPSTCNTFGRWDGEQWVPVLPATQELQPRDLATFDDGTGTALYFTDGSWGQAATGPIMRWDGSTLDSIPAPPGDEIWCMTTFDDGSGPALYAAGGNLHRWDGNAWSLVGGGLWREGGTSGTVYSMQAVEDGTRPGLYVSGQFTYAGDPAGTVVNNVARWDGTNWSAMGEGLPGVTGLRFYIAVLSEGPAQEILVAVRSIMAPALHRWDGTRWTVLAEVNYAIYDLLAWDDGRGPSAWFIGKFNKIGGVASSKLARYVPCLCYANCDGSTSQPVLSIDDLLCFIDSFAHAMTLPPEQQVNHYANCDGSTSPPILSVNDFTCFMDAYAAGCP